MNKANRTFEQEALAAYVILSFSPSDFVDEIDEMSNPGKAFLAEMLTTENPDMTIRNKKLNALGVKLLALRINVNKIQKQK